MTVHPHACGERVIGPTVFSVTIGSSPRLWGTVFRRLLRRRLGRFIPTPVGNGFISSKIMLSTPVHPHACGERSSVNAAAELSTGSSPRLWGTDDAVPVFADDTRFIPTPVGNGVSNSYAARAVSVHPHACGERYVWGAQLEAGSGSSPRLWGTVGFHLRVTVCDRFIPTPVGNGPPDSYRCQANTVHPHACGERAVTSTGSQCNGGSSPRLWGTVYGTTAFRPAGRFIPTPVGNGSSSGLRLTAGAVHPHACGERSFKRANRSGLSGSSPRLWGTEN